MSQPLIDSGTGAILVFSSTTWTAEITDIKRSGGKKVALRATTLNQTAGSGEKYISGKLIDYGEIEIEYHWNPDSQPPFTQTGENVIIKYPLTGTITTASQDSISAFIVDFGHSIPLENVMMGTLKLRCSGLPTHTNAG